jgi:uncharacterized protein (DUF169 family)
VACAVRTDVDDACRVGDDLVGVAAVDQRLEQRELLDGTLRWWRKNETRSRTGKKTKQKKW